MKICDLAQRLNMKVLTGEQGCNNQVEEIYTCDLLSLVMSSATKECAWVTVHTHLNIIAVAIMAQIQCIIIPQNIQVEEATINKAKDEGIVILSTEMNAYEVCWRAHDAFNQ